MSPCFEQGVVVEGLSRFFDVQLSKADVARRADLRTRQQQAELRELAGIARGDKQHR